VTWLIYRWAFELSEKPSTSLGCRRFSSFIETKSACKARSCWWW
jgi:hypothetical protein